MIDPQSLVTLRLKLTPATASLVRAEIENCDDLFQMLGTRRFKNWPPEDTADALAFFLQQLEKNPDLVGWFSWYWILIGQNGEGAELVGSGGFKGPPQGNGTVEVGYYVRPEYRRQGYATEAVAGLLSWAFGHEQVSRVVAETSAGNVPSIKLLESLGFTQEGLGSEAGSIRFRLGAQ